MKHTTLALLLMVVGAVASPPSSHQIPLPRVDTYPSLPSRPSLDWRGLALAFDEYIFSSAAVKYGLRWAVANDSFGIESYANDTRFKPGDSEGIPVMGTLLGAAVMKLHTHNGSRVTDAALQYVKADVGIFRDFPTAQTGGSFWYDLAPNIFAASLSDLYPDQHTLRVAVMHAVHQWAAAAETMGYNFTHTAFSFEKNEAVDNGIWLEADASAGVGWLAYSGHKASGNSTLLDVARRSIEALVATPWNPLYEMLLPYGALTAARLNAEADGEFNVSQILNWCLDATAHTRVGWGSVNESWGGQTCHGLIGSSIDGGGYAFWGNTLWFASALVPLVRYDHRFAAGIGKWMLHLASNSQYFFADALGDRQSGAPWTGDPHHVIGYEGVRKCDWSRPAGKCLHGDEWGPFGTGQNCGDLGAKAGSGACSATGSPTGQKDYSTDLGLYGGSFIGLLGGTVSTTAHPHIQQLDLNANDRFAPPSYRSFLLYNPMNKSVQLEWTIPRDAGGASGEVGIYDAISDVIVTHATSSNTVSLTILAHSAVMPVIVPPNSALVRKADGSVLVESVVVRFRTAGH